MNKIKIVAIVGTTCSGKSDLSFHLSQKFPFEIVNYDSLQIYRYLDIGTAKPPKEIREKIPHHLIDIRNPDEDFNAALFVEEADRVVFQIANGMKSFPLFVGGTGLYLRAFVYGIFKAEKDNELRRHLEKEYLLDPEALYEKLKEIDKEYALSISTGDKIRIIRALEIYYLTGKTMCEIKRLHGFSKTRYNVFKIGLRIPRPELYRRIDQRVEEMLKKGWIEEVESILRLGFAENAKAFTAIGYRHILAYIKGLIDYENMVRDIKKLTRHYAKRQNTWFSKERDVEWFSFPEDIEKIEKKVEQFLDL